MRFSRFRQVRWLLILAAGLAIVIAGERKWRRYAELRAQIAEHGALEERILAACEEKMRVPFPCGNERNLITAYLAVAAEHRRHREDCEREIRRIW